MKALAWHGKGDIRCDDIPDPKIEHPRDAIIKVTACAICGSDLHIYGGIIPAMKKGDVLGHENMGEVVEVGSGNRVLKVGDRIVVPFTIACGECFFCRNGFYSGCERTNPDHEKAAKVWGNSPAGLFGYSRLLKTATSIPHLSSHTRPRSRGVLRKAIIDFQLCDVT